jgi:ion channel
MHAIHTDHESRDTSHKFFLLFLFLLATLLLYPYAETSHFGYYTFRVLGSAAILLTVYAANFRRSLLMFALLLAIPALYQRIQFPRASASTFSVLSITLSFIFDVFMVAVISRHVFSKEEANSETIFGALCVYLLVGFSFASVYGMVAKLQPNAFYLDPITNLHRLPDRFDFIYYSFGTMTSLGAPGITAVTPEARSVAILQTILGVLYLAVLIARLMGAYRPGSRR